MTKQKKLWKLLGSMQFALILLLILAAVCTAGSLIPQQEIESYYYANYSQGAASLILGTGLDDVFHVWWFALLTGFLCLNLLLCNLVRFPQLTRRMKQSFTAEQCLARWDGTTGVLLADAEPLFKQMGFLRVEKLEHEGKECLYACKNKFGIWGAWLCHLGMLVVIVGFALGQTMQQEYTVYGIPGQTKPVGDTGYELTIDNFEIRLRADETVDQYEATLTMTNAATGESVTGFSSVNYPLSAFGWKLYQNSTGWAATMEVYRGGEHTQQTLLCAGEYAQIEGMDGLIVMLRAFYPDYAQDANGNGMTVSSQLNNPAYVYMIYYNEQLLGMNVLMGDERITVDDYSILFHSPQPYTLIQVKRDPFEWIVALGAAIIVAALLLAFYLCPAQLWAVRQQDGSWLIAGRAAKADKLYQDKLEQKIKALAHQKNTDNTDNTDDKGE